MRLQLRNLTRAAAPNGNPLKMLDADAQNALEAAHDIMRATGCGRISTAHLLLGILRNREVYALQSLADNNVDLDGLTRLARATITSGGQIATAQIRLDKGAKRALERARDIAPSQSRRRLITPQELLWGLLPRAMTLRERLEWGKPNDPLARVWSKIDVAPIERVLSVLLGLDVSVLEMTAVAETEPRKFNWLLFFLGALWAIPLISGVGALLFLGGLIYAFIIMLTSRPGSKLRVGSTSFAVGAIVVAMLLTFWFTLLG